MVSNLVVEIAIYNFDLFHYTLLAKHNEHKFMFKQNPATGTTLSATVTIILKPQNDECLIEVCPHKRQKWGHHDNEI